MKEVVTFKVRAKTHDKALHVFRVLNDFDKCSYQDCKDMICNWFNEFFPQGYYLNSVERKLLDFEIFEDSVKMYGNHTYLSLYSMPIQDSKK